MRIIPVLIVCLVGAFIGQVLVSEPHTIWFIGAITGVISTALWDH